MNTSSLMMPSLINLHSCDALAFFERAIITQADAQWHPLLLRALQSVNPDYLVELLTEEDWLPGSDRLFAAFRLPLTNTRYILLGESPYPRKESANGFAFWDASVTSLWGDRGFSKEVNRATSLRNFLKMLLYARGDLHEDFSIHAIARLNSSIYLQTATELFETLMRKGCLLLNASLVYSPNSVPYHSRQWRPFLLALLNQLDSQQLLLLGRIAEKIEMNDRFSCLVAEHPYNLSFITNTEVVNFFAPLDVLSHAKIND